jgi:hypothetical protein
MAERANCAVANLVNAANVAILARLLSNSRHNGRPWQLSRTLVKEATASCGASTKLELALANLQGFNLVFQR